MANNSFRIIGIRAVFPCPEEFPIGIAKHYEKVEAIQKALSESDRWHYFYHGIEIADNQESITMTQEAKRDFSLYDSDGLKISICAVVGKNGTGKSSLVELLVRTINNLAAALLGEGHNFSAAEHLHFIDYVFADLCFQIGNVVYILQSHGRHLKLTLFRARVEHYYEYTPFKTYDILNQSNAQATILPLRKHREGRRILKSLFYTMVCNYSLYGFNYRDFLSEATPAARLNELKIKVKDDNPTEDSVWLKGIFHKNDGYQTPVVLHPMREDGRLNVVKENLLAKERLAALLFYKDQAGNYPFRTINGNLNVMALHIRPTSRVYNDENILDMLDISTRQNVGKNFGSVRNSILKFWDDKYHILSEGIHKSQRDVALNYVVYKTLKIVKNYKKYRPVFIYLSRERVLYEKLKEKLEPLALDFSHITKKLLQTINYLTTDLYAAENNYYNLAELEQKMIQDGMKVRIRGRKEQIMPNLLPPPIFDMDLILSKGGVNSGIIPFNSISSGERQIAYTISNLMYHLVNVDSEWNDFYRADKEHVEVIRYRYMNVIFDEVELYYHPDMQRQFINIMLKTLKSVKFTNMRGINIMIVTHSPFVLSDIPDSNVLCMGVGDKRVTNTLGGNIMEMLSSSFFMENSIGDFIREDVSSIVDLYNRAVRKGENVEQEFIQRKPRLHYICDHLGDGFLKGMLQRMVDEVTKAVRN